VCDSGARSFPTTPRPMCPGQEPLARRPSSPAPRARPARHDSTRPSESPAKAGGKNDDHGPRRPHREALDLTMIVRAPRRFRRDWPVTAGRRPLARPHAMGSARAWRTSRPSPAAHSVEGHRPVARVARGRAPRPAGPRPAGRDGGRSTLRSTRCCASTSTGRVSQQPSRASAGLSRHWSGPEPEEDALLPLTSVGCTHGDWRSSPARCADAGASRAQAVVRGSRRHRTDQQRRFWPRCARSVIDRLLSGRRRYRPRGCGTVTRLRRPARPPGIGGANDQKGGGGGKIRQTDGTAYSEAVAITQPDPLDQPELAARGYSDLNEGTRGRRPCGSHLLRRSISG